MPQPFLALALMTDRHMAKALCKLAGMQINAHQFRTWDLVCCRTKDLLRGAVTLFICSLRRLRSCLGSSRTQETMT